MVTAAILVVCAVLAALVVVLDGDDKKKSASPTPNPTASAVSSPSATQSAPPTAHPTALRPARPGRGVVDFPFPPHRGGPARRALAPTATGNIDAFATLSSPAATSWST